MMPLMIQLNKFDYTNKDSIHHVIRYITRTRCNEDRVNELICYGSHHGYLYQKPVTELISEFEYVSNQYNAVGSLISHYIIQISSTLYAKMNNDPILLSEYATACCRYIFDLGHQTCFAIHYSKERKLHIHLVINTINYKTGKKLRQYHKEIKRTIEYPLINLIRQYYHQTKVNNIEDLLDS